MPSRRNGRTTAARRAAVLATALLLTGCAGGTSTDTESAAGEVRTVELEMRDIAFSPDTLQADAGETVRFVFHNTGTMQHDAYLGDAAAQDEHEMEMRASEGEDGAAGHGGGHGANDGSDGAAITVAPGDTGELTHTFNDTGDLLIGCHEPGHYAAGMLVTVNVA